MKKNPLASPRIIVEKSITIKDVCRGTLFFEAPRGDLMEVVDIEYNKKAGQPVKDQWGGVVWEEPFASIKARNTITGKVSGYAVQSQDSKLNDWLTFVKDKEEYKALTKPVAVTCTITVNLSVTACTTDEEIRSEVRRVLGRGDYQIQIKKG